MFKKIQPQKFAGTMPTFPHCDQRVLHAPGECSVCDQHCAEWQLLRQAWGIAFTGYTPEGNELPCPSDKARGMGTAEKWHGNQRSILRIV